MITFPHALSSDYSPENIFYNEWGNTVVSMTFLWDLRKWTKWLTEVNITTSKQAMASFPRITQYLWLFLALLIPPLTPNLSLPGAGLPFLSLEPDLYISQPFWLIWSSGFLPPLGWWLLFCSPSCLTPHGLLVKFSLNSSICLLSPLYL